MFVWNFKFLFVFLGCVLEMFMMVFSKDGLLLDGLRRCILLFVFKVIVFVFCVFCVFFIVVIIVLVVIKLERLICVLGYSVIFCDLENLWVFDGLIFWEYILVCDYFFNVKLLNVVLFL